MFLQGKTFGENYYYVMRKSYVFIHSVKWNPIIVYGVLPFKTVYRKCIVAVLLYWVFLISYEKIIVDNTNFD